MSFFELQRNYFVAFMVDESILMAIFRLLALLSHHGSVRDVNAHTREAIAQRRRPVILQWDDDPSRLVNEPPLTTDTYFRAAFGKLKRVIELRLNHELKIFVDESPLAVCPDRKSTRLNSSHLVISYAVFCLKKQIPITD